MARRANRSGFTLIELLVALVISAILVGVIFEFLLGQGRFARLQTAREEVQQNARSALEIVTAELRGAGADAISMASPDSIRFWAPRAWGLVCGYPGGVGTGNLAVIFPSVATRMLRNGPERRDSLAIPPVGASSTWRFFGVQDQTDTGLTDAVNSCNTLAPNPPLTTADWTQSRARLFSGVPNTVADSLAPGRLVYVHEEVRYNTGSSDLPGTWIQRSDASGMQPIAGPVPASGGLVFAYFKADGTDITGPLQTDPTFQDSIISRVRVTVVTESRSKFAGTPQRDSASTVVYLRNLNS